MIDATRIETMVKRLPRSLLGEITCEVLHPSRGLSPEVTLIRLNGELAVVKDQRLAPWWFRFTIGRLLMWRERRILGVLHCVAGVPRLVAEVDADAFVMEHIPGRTANQLESAEVSRQSIDRITEIISGIHTAGYAHGDLKRAANFMFSDNGDVYLLDFASAIPQGAKWNLMMRWVFAQISQTDWRGLAKLKQRLIPELLSEDEKRLLEEPVFLERLARRLMGR